MTKRDIGISIAVTLSIGIVLGIFAAPYVEPTETEIFVDLVVPAVQFPMITQTGDTVMVEKRWVARKDSAQVVRIGWLWTGREEQEGKWAVVREAR